MSRHTSLCGGFLLRRIGEIRETCHAIALAKADQRSLHFNASLAVVASRPAVALREGWSAKEATLQQLFNAAKPTSRVRDAKILRSTSVNGQK